jgi:hypothetical protein
VGKKLLQEKEELYKIAFTLVKKRVMPDISYQSILPKIRIAICATCDLGENYNVEYQALPDAHVSNDKNISGHIYRDCCLPYINKGKSGIVLPVPGLGVG